MKTNISYIENNAVIERLDDYELIPLAPELSEPLQFGGETLMKSVYYGTGMEPTLKPGDRMVLKKRDKMPYLSSEIYLIEWEGDNSTLCRLQESKREGCIYALYDNPTGLGGIQGQDIPIKYIKGIWELIYSQRMHSFSYPTMKIPVFRKQNINHS